MNRRHASQMLGGALVTALAALCLATPAAAGTTVPDDNVDENGDGTDTDETAPTGEATFAVQPSGPNGPGGRDHFVYTLKTGQVFGDVVSIANLSDARASFAIYATDAFNTSDAGFALLREDEEPVDVGSWIELGASQYTIEPRTRVDIPFRLEVPADATPGDHAGAIVAQQIPEEGFDPSGLGFDVRLRIGARVYVRVDGALSPSLTVENFTVGYETPLNPFGSDSATIDYVVRNTGNVRLATTAELELHGLFGVGRHELPRRTIPELLPGSSLRISETIHGVRPLIRQTTSLRIASEAEGVAIERSVTAWTVPWLALIVPVLVIALYVGVRRWRARPRTEAAASVPA